LINLIEYALEEREFARKKRDNEAYQQLLDKLKDIFGQTIVDEIAIECGFRYDENNCQYVLTLNEQPLKFCLNSEDNIMVKFGKGAYWDNNWSTIFSIEDFANKAEKLGFVIKKAPD
jgi:hypothetical protein